MTGALVSLCTITWAACVRVQSPLQPKIKDFTLGRFINMHTGVDCKQAPSSGKGLSPISHLQLPWQKLWPTGWKRSSTVKWKYLLSFFQVLFLRTSLIAFKQPLFWVGTMQILVETCQLCHIMWPQEWILLLQFTLQLRYIFVGCFSNIND